MMFWGLAYMNMSVMNFVAYSLIQDTVEMFYKESKHG